MTEPVATFGPTHPDPLAAARREALWLNELAAEAARPITTEDRRG